MYIFNLVLACWVLEDDDTGRPGNFLRDNGNDYRTLEELVKHWNNCNDRWPDIHVPCIKEHFELYETIPEELNPVGGLYDEAEVP